MNIRQRAEERADRFMYWHEMEWFDYMTNAHRPNPFLDKSKEKLVEEIIENNF